MAWTVAGQRPSHMDAGAGFNSSEARRHKATLAGARARHQGKRAGGQRRAAIDFRRAEIAKQTCKRYRAKHACCRRPDVVLDAQAAD
jgi:hypothetical protein